MLRFRNYDIFGLRDYSITIAISFRRKFFKTCSINVVLFIAWYKIL